MRGSIVFAFYGCYTQAKLFTLTDLFQTYGPIKPETTIIQNLPLGVSQTESDHLTDQDFRNSQPKPRSKRSITNDYSDYDYEEYLANTLDTSGFVSNLKNNESKAITSETLKRWTKIASDRKEQSLMNDAVAGGGFMPEHLTQEQRDKNYIEHTRMAKAKKMKLKTYKVVSQQ